MRELSPEKPPGPGTWKKKNGGEKQTKEKGGESNPLIKLKQNC